MIRDYDAQLPRSYLYFGYTTLVDLAVIEPRVLDDFRHAPLHPDLYDCGASVPLLNGYPMSFTSPELRFRLYPNWIFDPQHPTGLPSGADLTRHTPAAAVAAVKRAHGICVKTYFDRLGNDANVPVVTHALIAQVRRSARQYGLPLIMRANSFEAQQFAVDAKVDVIAHGMWNWGDLNLQPRLPPQIKALLDRIVARNIGYQPTMQVMQGFRAYFDPQKRSRRTKASIPCGLEERPFRATLWPRTGFPDPCRSRVAPAVCSLGSSPAPPAGRPWSSAAVGKRQTRSSRVVFRLCRAGCRRVAARTDPRSMKVECGELRDPASMTDAGGDERIRKEGARIRPRLESAAASSLRRCQERLVTSAARGIRS